MRFLVSCFSIGLIAGLMSGVFGVGGGIVIVPLLVLLFEFTQGKAVGTSLAALLLPVGLFAVFEYHRRGWVDWRAAGLLAAGLTLGAWLSARWATSIAPEHWLPKLFGVLLILVGLRFLLR